MINVIERVDGQLTNLPEKYETVVLFSSDYEGKFIERSYARMQGRRIAWASCLGSPSVKPGDKWIKMADAVKILEAYKILESARGEG
ncbi:MAG: hypothetical protein GY820_17365 [Gammaproteobacteria bacterium]|nr:hypothetical protein [Gammaproteobacteria bacterium]